MKFRTRCKIWFDKFEQLSPLYQFKGKFHVVYRDGEKTMQMDWGSAVDYADIFGGKVIHVSGEVVFEKGK